MHSNFSYKLRHLPDGKVLLCGGDGDPVLVDAAGRLQLNRWGTPMTVKDPKLKSPAKHQGEEIKVELKDYREIIQRLYQPRMNLRTQKIEVNGSPLDDAEFEELHVDAVEQHGYLFSKGNFQAVLRACAWRSKYDPVHTYISGLGTEDGPCLSEEEWDQIAVSTLGLKDSWSRVVLQKTLISAVARVMEPGCQVDTCLILHGEQGSGKSSLFRALAGEFFSDSMGDLENKKDDLMIFHRNWFNEWSEADQVFVGANKAERIKRFVSAVSDTFRAPYGRTTEAFDRRSILCGTTNRDDWANDPTGNRRFPILSPTAIDVEWTSSNRDAIWARAVVEYRKGSPWWFDKEEQAQITERASQYGNSNDECELIWEYLRSHSGQWFSTRALMIKALGRDDSAVKPREVSAMARTLSVLLQRGALKERRNYEHVTSLSTTRIKGICWSLPECDECNECDLF